MHWRHKQMMSPGMLAKIVRAGTEPARRAALRAADEAVLCHEIVRKLPCRESPPPGTPAPMCPHRQSGDCPGPGQGLAMMGLRQWIVTIIALAFAVWWAFAPEVRNHEQSSSYLRSEWEVTGR